MARKSRKNTPIHLLLLGIRKVKMISMCWHLILSLHLLFS